MSRYDDFSTLAESQQRELSEFGERIMRELPDVSIDKLDNLTRALIALHKAERDLLSERADWDGLEETILD